MFVFEDDGITGCVEAAEGHSDLLHVFRFRMVSADFVGGGATESRVYRFNALVGHIRHVGRMLISGRFWGVLWDGRVKSVVGRSAPYRLGSTSTLY